MRSQSKRLKKMKFLTRSEDFINRLKRPVVRQMSKMNPSTLLPYRAHFSRICLGDICSLSTSTKSFAPRRMNIPSAMALPSPFSTINFPFALTKAWMSNSPSQRTRKCGDRNTALTSRVADPTSARKARGFNFASDRNFARISGSVQPSTIASNWVQDIPLQRPATFIAAAIVGEVAATPLRHRFPEHAESQPRTSLNEIAPSRLRHAIITAEVITHTLVACHESGVQVLKTTGDGRLTLSIGEHRQQPDFHAQLAFAERLFNLVFEIDNATEPLDSQREQSIRTKILGYETYQDWVLHSWRESGGLGPRPSFRVVFLTTGSQRANHILWLAHDLARNPDRRLVYASTQDAYFGDPQAVSQPLFNDHHGHWQALVDPQPTSRFHREPVRLTRPIAVPQGL